MKHFFLLLWLALCLPLVTNAQIIGSTSYDFRNGSILPNDGTGTNLSTVTSSDNALIINQGTGGTFKFNDGTHGGAFKDGNTFTMSLAEQAIVTLSVCTYSPDGAVLNFTDAEGNDLGTMEAENNGGADDETREFVYSGTAQVVTATLVAGGTVYIHQIAINNTPTPIVGNTLYDFRDGSILPDDGTGTNLTSVASSNGALLVSQGTGGTFKFNDGTHGGAFKDGNTFTMSLAEQAIVTLSVCTYSPAGAVLNFTDAEGNALGTMEAENNGGADDETREFIYSGTAQIVTATLVAGGTVYIHAITIENAEPAKGLEGMIESWDFGAELLDTLHYINMLDSDMVNAWYDTTIVAGSSGNKLPDFTTGALSWTGKPASDRLRTSNESLTRYDENVSGGDAHTFTGRTYANGTVSTGDDGLPTNRYFTIEVSEDDEVVISAIAQNGSGTLTFVNENDITDIQQLSSTSEVQDYLFVASTNGVYRIYDATDKLSCYRILHRNAEYVTISGAIDESAATGIKEGYGISFENTTTGKTWTPVVSSAAYSVKLPAGFTYNLALTDANGYLISNLTTLDVTAEATVDFVVEQLALSTISGSISGLNNFIQELSLVYTPDSADKIYVPEVSIDTATNTYTAVLESSCPYTISAEGVNDFDISSTAITVSTDQTIDVTFTAKPVYKATITTSGLDAEPLSVLKVTFTNLDEEGYIYSFDNLENITLRDGVYSVITSGTDSFAVAQELTSNIVIDGADVEKNIAFSSVSEWNFDEKEIDGYAYFGLLFSSDGLINNQATKSHLVGKPGGKIYIPATVGDKVTISYYYNADLTIDTDTQLITTSGSTSTIESYGFIYDGSENDTLTISIGNSLSTSYITCIKVSSVLDYAATITVGEDKDYQTINEALDAISQMDRTEDQRVTVMVDPGNYEEMIVINQANVSLVNASASPSISLTNQGVNIDENAVRITSYYGHGYSYYSMSSDQRWHEDVLAVNKENGYLSYANKGAGTTNGSYWNATLVVEATGFECEYIIIENSFNQYISTKESEDIVEEWETGGKGTRPVTQGNVEVQDRTYVERGAAIAITSSGDKTVLVNCRVVGRQDSFYGSKDARVVMYGGAAMGAVDYIFGGMTAIFYKTDLVLNTCDASNDIAYITAAQQESGRGFLMYECKVKSPSLNTETASQYKSKPGYFGRPWSPNTSEVVFFNTTIDSSSFAGYEGQSLIMPIGWMSSLGGESPNMCEYGTVEHSGEDNSTSRASWSNLMTTTSLDDGTEVTTLNFTKGNDGWDPIPQLIESDPILAVTETKEPLDVNIFATKNQIIVKTLLDNTTVQIYNLQGVSIINEDISYSASFSLQKGLWIVKVSNNSGAQIVKIIML